MRWSVAAMLTGMVLLPPFAWAQQQTFWAQRQPSWAIAVGPGLLGGEGRLVIGHLPRAPSGAGAKGSASPSTRAGCAPPRCPCWG